MEVWTLEKANDELSEVVRLALAHEPQMITRSDRAEDVVVVIALSDYEHLLSSRPFVQYVASLPSARDFEEGVLRYDESADFFPQDHDVGRKNRLD